MDRLRVVRIVLLVGALASGVLSGPLWLANRAYPAAPLFGVLALPPLFNIVLLAVVIGAFFAFTFGHHPRYPALVAVFGYVLLALADQTRFQPWAFQYALMVAAVGFARTEKEALNGCRLIVAAIYLWSGLHKMNDGFSSQTFPWLVSPLGLPESLIAYVAPLIPFAEAAMGLALFFPSTRRYGVVAVLGMHLFLLSVLGPWALDWNHVVYPWNVAMLILVPTLFLRTPDRIQRTSLICVFAFLVGILPPLSFFGLWDTYLSFAMYSGNPLYGDVLVSFRTYDKLDVEAKRRAEPDGSHYRIRLEEWSYAELNVPAFPSERVLRRIAGSYCPFTVEEGDLELQLMRSARWGYREGFTRLVPRRELCALPR